MRFPENLKKGDTIGICAPSDGVIEYEDIKKLDTAICNLKELGYNVIETESVRKSKKGRSATPQTRAKEFMNLMKNDDVKAIMYLCGGDFLMEMLDYIDFEKLKKLKPKWTVGFSDITHISLLLNTILDIPSIYCDNVKSYAMKPLYNNLEDVLKLMHGEEIVQASFKKYEKTDNKSDDYSYNLTENVKWKNITGEKEILMNGRAIGGCLDCIIDLIGTKYDYVKEYIDKYKKDGIIWFLECYEMNTPMLTRVLWQMKNAGYFENCNGIIFGRSFMMREDYNISFDEAVLDAIKSLEVPIITNADIGHIPPQLAIVNGAILKITSRNGKGKVETYLK